AEWIIMTVRADRRTVIHLDVVIASLHDAVAVCYRVYIGTTPGETDVADGIEVAGTTFTPEGGFTEGTVYYVSVIPYNAAGQASGCMEISFAAKSQETTAGTKYGTAPNDRSAERRVGEAVTWTAAGAPEGYRVYIRTAPGASDVADGVEVSGTIFSPEGGFTEGTVYYVSVIPYNAAGQASGCMEISFAVKSQEDIARTKYGISPNGDGINDFWKIDGITRYPDNVVSVYNRWGDMVFQVQQYDNQSRVFTGIANRITKFGAGILPSGTYFFIVQYRDQQELKKVEGFLVLKR